MRFGTRHDPTPAMTKIFCDNCNRAVKKADAFGGDGMIKIQTAAYNLPKTGIWDFTIITKAVSAAGSILCLKCSTSLYRAVLRHLGKPLKKAA